MKKLILIFICSFIYSDALFEVNAQEAINLTVPKTTPNITQYTPGTLFIDNITPKIIIQIINMNGDVLEFNYPCAAPCSLSTPASVAVLIGQLNTANLTTRSLWRRIFDRLILDFPTRFVGGATVQ